MWNPDSTIVSDFLKESRELTLEVQLSYPDGFSWGDFSQASKEIPCREYPGRSAICGPEATKEVMDRHSIIASFGGHQHFISNGYMLKNASNVESLKLKADPGQVYHREEFYTASESMITLPASAIGKVILCSATETIGIGKSLKRYYEYNRPIGILKLKTGEVGIGFQSVAKEESPSSLDKLKDWIFE
jgi:hypothetical protein